MSISSLIRDCPLILVVAGLVSVAIGADEPGPTPTSGIAAETPCVPAFRSGKSGKRIDLLGLIDLGRDRVSGSWDLKEDGLWMVGGHRPKLSFPVVPQASYELHTEFTMKEGFQFGITLPANSSATLLWVTAAHKGGKDSISLSKYHDAEPYILKKTPSRDLVGGRRCMIVRVEMRGKEAQFDVVLDDERVLVWRGSKDSLTVNPDYRMRKGSLGLTNWGTTVVFHQLDMRILPDSTSEKAAVREERSHRSTRGLQHKLCERVQNTSWASSPEDSKPSMTFLEGGKARGASASVQGRWYAVDQLTVIAEWKRRIYVVTFAPDLQAAKVYRKGRSWEVFRADFQG